jgi:hypothetical protein
MKLRYIIYGFIGLVVLLIGPVIVEILVNMPVPSVADEKTWIGFYGSFLGGLFGAFALIFITLYQINKNKELEIYKEDIKDLTYLKMIEQFVESNQFSIFTDLFSPILEKYRRHTKNKDLTVSDLKNYFNDLQKQFMNDISIKDEYKLSYSLEDFGTEEFFGGKELFGIETLSIEENLFKVEEKQYDWGSHLTTVEMINGYFNALSSLQYINKEFSRKNDLIIDEMTSEVLDSNMFKIIDNNISPEEIKSHIKKIYSQKMIGNRFIAFLLCFHKREELDELLKLIRAEIDQKNSRIKSFRSKNLSY